MSKPPNFTIIAIGENIRKWRILKGYKQSSFADELEISNVALSKIETGKTDVSIGRLLQIATVLEIAIELLFKEPTELIMKGNKIQ